MLYFLSERTSFHDDKEKKALKANIEDYSQSIDMLFRCRFDPKTQHH